MTAQYAPHYTGFRPDIEVDFVVPVHPGNVIAGTNTPKVLVLHTPEEPADDYESTPPYFRDADRDAGTHYYGDNDGDLYALCPEHHCPIANGVRGKPYPEGTDPDESLNRQSLSIELEGYARSMHRTCRRDGRQWSTTRNWIVSGCWRHRIPITRRRVIRHDEVANNRGDPGTLDVDGLVAEAREVAEQFADALRRRPEPLTPQQANMKIRAALARAWTMSDWAELCKQLRYLQAC